MEDCFQLRIVTVDHYLSQPSREFDDDHSIFTDSPINLVPVIRVFGITKDGKKACLHVHGYYPYISIPFDSDKHIDVGSYKKKLGSELDRVLSSNNVQKTEDKNYYTKRRVLNHIFSIRTIKATPFYGFHARDRSFLRIQFFNPNCVQRATEALQSGSVLNNKFQVYEAHIPYILKFFIDYNLQGMNFVGVTNVFYRKSAVLHGNSHQMSPLESSTTCELECDCTILDILNRSSKSGEIFENPGLKLLRDDERARRRKLNLNSQVTPQSSQERANQHVQNDKEQFFLNCVKRQVFSHSTDVHSANQNSSQSSLVSVQEYSTQDYVKVLGDLIRANNQWDYDCEWEESDEAVLSQEMSKPLQNTSSCSGHYHLPLDLSASSDSSPRRRSSAMPLTSPNFCADRESEVLDCNECCDLSFDQHEHGEVEVPCKSAENLQFLTGVDVANTASTSTCPPDCRWRSVSTQIDSRQKENSTGLDINDEFDWSLVQLDGSYDGTLSPRRKSQRIRKPSQRLEDTWSDKKSSNSSAMSANGDGLFISHQVNGTTVKIPATLPEKYLEKLGKESVAVERVSEEMLMRICSRNSCCFQKNSPCFYKTRLTGKRKLEHLMSMCRPLKVDVTPSETPSGSNDVANFTRELFESEHSHESKGISSPIHTEKDQSVQTELFSSDSDPYVAATQLLNKSFLQVVKPSNDVVYCNKSDTTEELSCLSPATQIYCVSSDETVEFLVSSEDTLANGPPSDKSDACSEVSDATQVYDGIDLAELSGGHEVQDNIDELLSRNSLSDGSSSTEIFDFSENMASNDQKLVEEFNSQSSNRSGHALFSSSIEDGDYDSDGILSFYEYETQSSLSEPPSGVEFSETSEPHTSILHSTPNTSLKTRRLCSMGEKLRTQLETVFEEETCPSDNRKTEKNCVVNKNLEKIPSRSSPRTSVPKQRRIRKWSNNSLIEEASHSNTFDFDISSYGSSFGGSQEPDVAEAQHLTVMSMEIFASTPCRLKPDPATDSIRAVFYAFGSDDTKGFIQEAGIILVHHVELDLETSSFTSQVPGQFRKKLLLPGYSAKKVQMSYAVDEFDLLTKLIELIRNMDPDMVVGYELETMSWGYLVDRANALNIKVVTALSRVVDERVHTDSIESETEKSGLRLPGRILLNLWTLLRKEITLNIYTYENAHYHVLHERIPQYSFEDLNEWFDNPVNFGRVIEYYLIRVEGCLRILHKLNLIDQTSELARVFGIQFSEVLSRGSQFRVESLMVRSAKPRNFIMVSPSQQQRVSMRAPVSLPLIMEPESAFYTDPVAVLDFQSLYPSIIIAYNYCYSTCLGRLEHLGQEGFFDFGCCDLYVPKTVLKQHIDSIHVAPNEVAFFKRDVRAGVLPQLLQEILDTRVVVKNAIKENNGRSRSLEKLLNARQLGLKLIANVTYGYTGANYSGRMPCVEIADAIVSKARETLQNAIELVHSNPHWGGRVIYGDTDSMFVLFKGCSKSEAFARAREIVDAVTLANPSPVKLKFEKIFLPCVLETKKRYVGYSYEKENQKEPIFDAKGIETVRRDTCPAASKMLEKSLKLLFDSYDINDVRPYVQRQFEKILNGRVSCLQDFIFAREYRGRENYQPSACVPALEIARKLRSMDPRAEPRKGERVPYVVVYGSDEQLLIHLVRQPLELVKDLSLKLNGKYYIEKVIIPALNRVVQLVRQDGVQQDVFTWYKEIPRRNICQRSHYHYTREKGLKKRTLSQYFVSAHCVVCQEVVLTGGQLCATCLSHPQLSCASLIHEIRHLESKYGAILLSCQACTGSKDTVHHCRSMDCPQLFRYAQARLDIANVSHMEELLEILKPRIVQHDF